MPRSIIRVSILNHDTHSTNWRIIDRMHSASITLLDDVYRTLQHYRGYRQRQMLNHIRRSLAYTVSTAWYSLIKVTNSYIIYYCYFYPLYLYIHLCARDLPIGLLRDWSVFFINYIFSSLYIYYTLVILVSRCCLFYVLFHCDAAFWQRFTLNEYEWMSSLFLFVNIISSISYSPIPSPITSSSSDSPLYIYNYLSLSFPP